MGFHCLKGAFGSIETHLEECWKRASGFNFSKSEFSSYPLVQWHSSWISEDSHWITKAETGHHLWKSSNPILQLSEAHQEDAAQDCFQWVLECFKGDLTTSLRQCPVTPTVKGCYLVFRWNFRWNLMRFSLCSFSLILKQCPEISHPWALFFACLEHVPHANIES